jgi:hypothetical protein
MDHQKDRFGNCTMEHGLQRYTQRLYHKSQCKDFDIFDLCKLSLINSQNSQCIQVDSLEICQSKMVGKNKLLDYFEYDIASLDHRVMGCRD